MNILHVSTSDMQGGAARAAYRLHKGLQILGVTSTMYVQSKESADAAVECTVPSSNPAARTLRLLRRWRVDGARLSYRQALRSTIQPFSDDRTPYRCPWQVKAAAADVLHLHLTNGFVDLPSFFANVRPDQPIVATLHDMNYFTGGCHNSFDCNRFVEQCGKCPQLGSHKSNDLSRAIWERKQAAYTLHHAEKLRFVADSEDLARAARRSGLLRRFEVSMIHYGLDLELFTPKDKASCRKVLGIPNDEKVILFSAANIHDPRKGFAVLLRALEAVSEKGLAFRLLTFGRGHVSGTLPFQVDHFGFVFDERLQAVIYNCADAFVIPSLSEPFGQTSIEAMACGVPVVGSRTGGIPDMVSDGVTGFLVEPGSAEEICNRLEWIVRNPREAAALGQAARRHAVNHHSMTAQAEKYLHLYQSLVTT